MSRVVTFDITHEVPTIVKVTSINGQDTYFSGKHPGNNETLEVSISVPNTVNSLLLNGEQVDLASTKQSFNSLKNIFVEGPKLEDISGNREIELVNYAPWFDGIDDYIMIGDVTQLNNVGTFTIEGWANQNTNTDSETIFSKEFDGDNDITLRTDAGALIIEVGNGFDSYATWAGYSGSIASNNWFHWAIVFDGAGGTDADRLKLYINGNMTPIVLAFTGSIPATSSSSLSTKNLKLSKSGTDFHGYMDELRIWSSARSAGNINSFYNKIISSSSTNLKGYWRMNEGSGSTAYDGTIYNYHATIFGCLWTLFVNSWDSDGDGVFDLTDDYPLDATRAFDNFFPAADTGTVVYEDIWPCYGDYDFNDLVMGYQFKTVTNASNEVVEIFGTFITRANGAVLVNGFGFELPAADAGVLSNVVVTGYNHTQGHSTIDGTTHLESSQTNPVIVVVDRVNDFLGEYTNTDPAWPYESPVTTIVKIEVTNGASLFVTDFSLELWNPFLFINHSRDYELHLFDHVPTDLANSYFFGLCDDRSVPLSNEYYRNATGLPWALDFPVRFEYPEEKVDIRDTYLHFVEWAESGKTQYQDWYSNPAAGYRNQSNIYEIP